MDWIDRQIEKRKAWTVSEGKTETGEAGIPTGKAGVRVGVKSRGKLIAVAGAPGSGKTVLCTLLGRALAERERDRDVLVLFPGQAAPPLPSLFPSSERGKGSLRPLLPMPRLTEAQLLSQVVSLKSVPNLGYLGHPALAQEGEPAPVLGTQPSLGLLRELTERVDYVLCEIDSETDPVEHTLSRVALERADGLVHLRRPDLTGVHFEAVCSPGRAFLRAGGDKRNILNVCMHTRPCHDTDFPLFGEERGMLCETIPFSAPLDRAHAYGYLGHFRPTGQMQRALSLCAERLAALLNQEDGPRGEAGR